MRKLILFISAIFISSCGSAPEVVYDVPFGDMVSTARETGSDFCVVISRTDCPPCADYVQSLTDHKNRRRFANVRYNVVDVSQPESRWYIEWLCLYSFPTTCVFSSDGKLKAVVSGASGPAIECIESAVDGKAKCADYFYERPYRGRGNYLAILNDLLTCKFDLDAGKDIGEVIDEVLNQTDYPYPVYLKALNEQKQGRTEQAAELGRRLLAFDDLYYYYVYNDLFTQAKYIINPDYTPLDDAILTMNEEIALNDCKVGEPRRFSIEVANTGKFPLSVRNIKTSCTCLKLLTPAQFRLEAGKSSLVDVEFTAEGRGDFYREVMFFSDAAEAMQRVAVRAQVGEQQDR